MSGKRSKGNYGRPQTGVRVGTCPLIENVQDQNYNFNYILVRTNKEPKSLPPDTFHWLKIYLNCDCGQGFTPNITGGANSAPADPL